MYIKDWFKSIFPLCLTRILRLVTNAHVRYCPHLLPQCYQQTYANVCEFTNAYGRYWSHPLLHCYQPTYAYVYSHPVLPAISFQLRRFWVAEKQTGSATRQKYYAAPPYLNTRLLRKVCVPNFAVRFLGVFPSIQTDFCAFLQLIQSILRWYLKCKPQPFPLIFLPVHICQARIAFNAMSQIANKTVDHIRSPNLSNSSVHLNQRSSNQPSATPRGSLMHSRGVYDRQGSKRVRWGNEISLNLGDNVNQCKQFLQ